MSPALILFLLATAVPGHQDWTLIPKQCESCHVGHGVSGLKLLPLKEPDHCLQCHGGPGPEAEMVKKGYLSATAKPQDLSRVLTLPYRHDDLKACGPCHAGHGIADTGYTPHRVPKPSPKKPNQYEYELCASCHGTNLLFVSPVSFHSVTTLPKQGTFPSLVPPLTGLSWINCSDCHGYSDASVPAGVHGSPYPSILTANYQGLDGQEETADAYAQCYLCHSRDSILKDESFPLHREHIVDRKTSCYTCHDSHAGRTLPHLLAIEDESRSDRIAADGQGRRTFQQTGDRAGICYLTCHNVEHDGWAYGPNGKKRSFASEKMKSMPGANKGPAPMRPQKNN